MSYALDVPQPVNLLPHPRTSYEAGKWLPKDFTASSGGHMITTLAIDISFKRSGHPILQKADLQSEFVRLAKEWRNDMRGVSSLSDMFMHGAYQRIMAM